MFKNLMIDIETLGNTSNATILSIAAVPFSLTEIGEPFLAEIDLEDSMKYGSQSASTLKWWIAQDRDTFETAMSGSELLASALVRLSKYYSELKVDIGLDLMIWANSPDFDLKIIENKLEKLNLKPIWLPWNQRCVRTLKAINPVLAKSFINNEKHNPLQDCLVQIDQIKAINEKYNLNLIS